MAKRIIMTGWGRPDYAPAAAMMLRCAFKCMAEVEGVSQRGLPAALRRCETTCAEVYVLGVGLGYAPKETSAELARLRSVGVKVWWISACAIPQEFAVDFATRDGGSVFDRVVVSHGDLFAAVRMAFPRHVSAHDVAAFRRYAAGDARAGSEEALYRRLFAAADWKHKNDREMGYYPQAIFSLASGVEYANIASGLAAIVTYCDKWGGRVLNGTSTHMAEVRRLADLAAKCDDPEARVLITGPSGTGKETVAQMIHRKSARADGAFLSFNCACTTASLFESKLFGSVRGAYTDSRDAPGLFEAAADGTLFLDEVAELDLEMQGQLLRVLQDGDYLKVGESLPRKVQNVRVITATNKDLVQLVNEGRFREDLYYRLNVLQIRMKALAERPEDIPEIAQAIWYRETGAMLSAEQREALMQYDFPGNARELENMLLLARIVKQSDFTELVESWRRNNRGLHRLPAEEPPDDVESLDIVIARHVRKIAERYRGHSMREIANRLGRAENTVRGWLKYAEEDR